LCPIWNIPTIIVACKLAAIHGADVPLYEQSTHISNGNGLSTQSPDRPGRASMRSA
jgi:hypothetical protein